MTVVSLSSRFRALSLAALFVITSVGWSATTVTVVTHGLDASIEGWVTDMSYAIAQQQRSRGMESDVYAVYYSRQSLVSVEPQFGVFQKTFTSTNRAKSVVIAFDWSWYSKGELVVFSEHSNTEVGPKLARLLTKPDAIAGLEAGPLATRTLHLIGHSRGGSLMCGVSELLPDAGFVVDQLTTLDPRPWGTLLTPDYPARVGRFVRFADNYFQRSDVAQGSYLEGAANRQLLLYDSYSERGNPQVVNGAYKHHQLVHDWYEYTINGIPWSGILRENWALYKAWYTSAEEEGDKAGYYFSWCAYGVRPREGYADRRVGRPRLISRLSDDGDWVWGWEEGPTGTFRLQSSSDLVLWTDYANLQYLDGKEYQRTFPKSEVKADVSSFYRLVPPD